MIRSVNREVADDSEVDLHHFPSTEERFLAWYLVCMISIILTKF